MSKLNVQGLARRDKGIKGLGGQCTYLIPEEGNVFVSMDLTSGEPTVTAHYSGDIRYRYATLDGAGQPPFWDSEDILMIDDIYLMFMSATKEGKILLKELWDKTFPEGDFTNPTGGFFIWWQPKGDKAFSFDVRKFNQEVLHPNDVLVVPGAAFYPPHGHSYEPEAREIEPLRIINGGMRIGYSFLKPELIDVGVRKLGNLLKENL